MSLDDEFNIEPGSLVKISDAGSIIKGEILGWIKVEHHGVPSVRVHIFKEKELYGMYLGNPIISGGVMWHNVLIDKIYLFSEYQLNQFTDLSKLENEDWHEQ